MVGLTPSEASEKFLMLSKVHTEANVTQNLLKGQNWMLEITMDGTQLGPFL